MPRQEKYYLGPDLLGQIRKSIARTANDPIADNTFRVQTRYSDIERFADCWMARGTFTATSWAIGDSVPVTLQGQTNTISVTNYTTPVVRRDESTDPLNVVFGDIMGTMTVVEVQQPTCTMSVGGLDLTALPGYDRDAVQLLGHAADTESTACLGLQWYSVTQCGA